MAGLGAFNTTSSEYGQQYLKQIQGAGQQIAGAGAGLAAFDMEIGRRKAEAESKMGKLDDSKMTGTDIKALTGTAERMKENINGGVETAYDFSNTRSIAQFQKDVASLNDEIKKSEQNFIDTMGTAEDGPESLTFYGLQKRREISMARGKDASEGFTFENLGGEGIDYYDGKSADFKATTSAKSMMDADVTVNPDGTYNMTFINDIGEEETRQNLTLDEIRRDQREAVLPSYQSMPDLSGAQFVRDKSIGPNKYETSNQAASAYIQEVMSPGTKAAALRYAKKRTGSRDVLQTTLTTESREKLMEKYGIPSPDGFTEEQFQYFEEMMQEWHDEKNADKFTASGGGGRGNKSDILNTAPQIELGITTKATDEYGTEMFVLGGDGSVVSSMGPTVSNKTSSVIRLPDELDVAISLGYEDGEAQPARNVKVRKIGYDGASPFGIATFDIDGEEQSIRIPLPIAGGGESVGDLYAAILQQYKMTEAEYDDMVGRLTESYVNHNEAE